MNIPTVIVRVERPGSHEAGDSWLVRSRNLSINRYIQQSDLPQSVRLVLAHRRYAHFHVIVGDHDRLTFGTVAGDLPW